MQTPRQQSKQPATTTSLSQLPHLPSPNSNKPGNQLNPITIDPQPQPQQQQPTRDKTYYTKILSPLKHQPQPSQPRTPINPNAIHIQSYENAIDPNSTSRTRVFFYVLEGNSNRKYRTNELNLLDKIEKQKEGHGEGDGLAVDGLGEDEDGDKQQSGQEQGGAGDEEEGLPVTMRYFSSADDKAKFGKCRRCKLDGHYQRNCIQKQSINCYICLGNHRFTQCGRGVCYNCNQTGHLAKDCPKRSVKCHNCNKFGHVKSDCNILLRNDEFNPEQYSQTDLKKTICMNCGEKGHPICKKIHYPPDRLYRDEAEVKLRKNQRKVRREQEEDGYYVHVTDDGEERGRRKERERERREQREQRERQRELDEQRAYEIMNPQQHQPRNRGGYRHYHNNYHQHPQQDFREVVQIPTRNRNFDNRQYQDSRDHREYNHHNNFSHEVSYHNNSYDRRNQYQAEPIYSRGGGHRGSQQPHQPHQPHQRNQRPSHQQQPPHQQPRPQSRQDYRQAFNQEQAEYIRRINRDRTGFQRRRAD